MIGIIVAMKVEFQLFEALLVDKKEEVYRGFHFLCGKVQDKSVVLMQSGIGKVCAAAGTVEMSEHYAPDYILNTGVAGGIDSKLRVMDIVVGKEVVYHDVWCGKGNEYGQVQGLPARFVSDKYLYGVAMAVKSEVLLQGGLICSGDKFITSCDELHVIKNNFPDGLAVDMESGAIAQVCCMLGIPFLNCRIISDTPGFVEDHTAQYKNFWTLAPEKSVEVLQQIIERI